MKAQCQTCFHHCALDEEQTGFCGARKNQGGKITCANYGRITGLALDPIEKKPLAMFYPGKMILSIGSYGCNLACPFCQNYSISREFSSSDCSAENYAAPITSEALLEKALELKSLGNIGIAFTYNEPLVGWEFVRDTAKLFHEHDNSREHGLKNVIVTNGCFPAKILDEVLPYIDAMNIDLKAFSDEGYKKLGGDFETVLQTIKTCAASTHVELTTLIVPGLNDSAVEMREEAKWISSIGKDIPLHVTRFFPRYKMNNAMPTPTGTVYKLADAAREFLNNVFVGNC